MQGWILLFIGIVFEVAGTFCIKLSQGFTYLIPSVLSIILFITSLSFVNFALKTIDVSVGYAIWSGVGIASLAVLGHFHFDETLSIPRVIFIVLILIGVIGLQLVD